MNNKNYSSVNNINPNHANHSIIRRLQDFSIMNSHNSFSQNSMANRLLDFIFQDSISYFTLEDLALHCNVSTATFSRFIKELGYTNYKEFKQTILNYQNIKEEVTLNASFSIADYHAQIADSLAQAASLLEKQDIAKLADLICSQHNIYFFGIHYTEMILKELQYNLLKIGKRVFWFEGVINQIDALNQIEADSVCLFFSTGGKFIQAVLPVLMQRNDFTSVLVTSQDNEKFQVFFDQTIFLSQNSENKERTYQLQFMCDILFECVKNRLLFDE